MYRQLNINLSAGVLFCFFLDRVSEMTQAANQELLNQQTLSLPSESSVVNDIAGKKFREDLSKCVKKVKNCRSTDGIFPSYIVTEGWGGGRKKTRTEKVNG